MPWAGARDATGPLEDGWERIADVPERVKRGTACAVSGERRRWNWSVKAKRKGG